MFPANFGPGADTSIVDPVPTAHHRVCPTVALIKPETQSKRVSAKGKGVSDPVTQPRAWKVTCIVSPLPEVIEFNVPIPPIASPSWGNLPSVIQGASCVG